MSNKYSHLLSPIKIGNVVLKNRMLATKSTLHFLQGPESFPNDQMLHMYADRAKNGAAVVECNPGWNIKPRGPLDKIANNRDSAHSPMWDIEDPAVQNYFSQMTDAIHFYDSKACAQLRVKEIAGYNISDVAPTPDPPSSGRFVTIHGLRPAKELPIELMQEMIEDYVQKVMLLQSVGFDMVNVYMSYRNSTPAYALSPLINKRKDKYGGSLENRGRFALELFQAIKKACGQDFLIEVQISGEEKIPGGYTIEDACKYIKLWENTIDLVQLRGWNGSVSHPVGFNSQKRYPLTLKYAQAVKESGTKVVTVPNGGYLDLDLNEEYIATGKTDMIGMARPFICDPEYGKKAYEGRGDDVVPCIRCNKCHVPSLRGDWFNVCSVNPKIGIAHKVNQMVDPPTTSKKVAVIGGGPAGMRAAIFAAERGHKVTLFEKNYFLGGQLRHADFASFKWPVRDFKDYLIRQLDKAGVEVRLGTEATQEMIKAAGFDAVLVAAGAEPVIPNIPGVKGHNVRTAPEVFGNEKTLGKNVVVVGGGEIGLETGMYLAETGHNVTVLEMLDELANDATPIHYAEMIFERLEELKNFKSIVNARCNGISAGKVTYIDAKGKEQSIKADSVVLAVGMKPNSDLALKFYGSADRFFILGDCRKVGSVQTSQRSAFATASQI
jgi:2,4-dienoyl-CoA reductase-like NADH-dependent reductase (Old Yellow Enzyme family)/thioredoxin reductase